MQNPPVPLPVPVTEESEDGSFRDWANLTWDVLSVIFEKLGAAVIIVAAECVCKPWWRLAHEPRIWRRIEMLDRKLEEEFSWLDIPNMASLAVDRSDGCLVEFLYCHDEKDKLLKLIAERSTQLKQLHLEDDFPITENGLMEACKSFPSLE